VLALRLARRAHVLVQVRRLLVALASAGTGFLLLCAFGHALAHPEPSADAALRLAWCAVPAAASVYLAVAVARTDPGTRPRPGLAAIGLGPGRLRAVSVLTTALSCALGSAAALLLFLHLRGGLPGLPHTTRVTDFLATGLPLPFPATATLLAVVPLAASAACAMTLRPGARTGRGAVAAAGGRASGARTEARVTVGAAAPRQHRQAGARRVSPGWATITAGADAGTGARESTGAPTGDGLSATPLPVSPRPAPTGLPWGVATVAAGLAVEAYANRSPRASGLGLPGDFTAGPAAVLAGWALTAVGLALAGPALTHLCGRLLQAVRPGALRLLAGRVLQEEARRIGRPLGVVCAVASGAYAAAVHAGARPSFGPLTTLGALLVAGCTLATLATAAVEARQARAETTAALLRIGAPASLLRVAALLRAGALTALFAPLTWAVAQLAALPLTR
jgi:hypothetical protein